jgi:hypothetical protein
MPSELPSQLRWNDFVAAIKRVGYSLFEEEGISANLQEHDQRAEICNLPRAAWLHPAP